MSTARSVFRLASRTSALAAPARSKPIFQLLRHQSHRQYSNAAPKSSKTGLFVSIGALTAAVAVGGGGYYFYPQSDSLSPSTKLFMPTREDFQQVYDEIARHLEDWEDYDDGSFGPVLVRLAWHASGTYDKNTKTGGSNGATMRFDPEAGHGANAGLKAARDYLEPIKQKFPWITYSDLWTLGGVCAIQQMLGPAIKWRPGRRDGASGADCTPDGRLPDASKTQDHLRDIFGRMGLGSDREIVALSGAHALGRCHTYRSGYDGPWTHSPTVLTNEFYRLLLLGEEGWAVKKWEGPRQYVDSETGGLMMLESDMALVRDRGFRGWVERYAADEGKWFRDFAEIFGGLLELGVPFREGVEGWTFRVFEGDDEEE